MIRKRHNQKVIPTLKPEVGKPYFKICKRTKGANTTKIQHQHVKQLVSP